MIIMRSPIFCLLFFLFLILGACKDGSDNQNITTAGIVRNKDDVSIHLKYAQGNVFVPFDIDIHVDNPTSVNPFLDSTVEGFFKHENGSYLVKGFSDSYDGSFYKIRFCPEWPGEYEIEIKIRNENIDFSKIIKVSVAENVDKKGFLTIGEQYPFFFQYSKSRDFYFPISNTAYGLLGLNEPQIYHVIDKNLDLGINRIRFVAQAKFNDGEYGGIYDGSWSGNINPFLAKGNFDKYDLVFWRKFERVVGYMYKKGMIASILFTIDRQGEFPEEGSDEENRYFTYLIARLSAFPNVMFDFGNEHNEYRSVPSWANSLAKEIKKINPYDNLMSAHGYEDFLYTSESWPGWQILQHYGTYGELRNAVLKHRVLMNVPVINEEFGYEANSPEGVELSSGEVRKKAWTILMAGGFFTYGNGQGDFITGRISTDSGYALTTGYFRVMRDFFESIPYWKLEPVVDMKGDGYLSCVPNELCLFYVPGGGQVDNPFRQVTDRLGREWGQITKFDVRSGDSHLLTSGVPDSGTSYSFGSSEDWLYIFE